MKDFLKIIGSIVGVMLIILILICSIMIPYCYMKAKTLNQRYDTNYTTSDMFWCYDNIIVSEHVELKGKSNGK